MAEQKSSWKNLIYATATLVGATIGVGIFGLPYTARQSGIETMIAFFIFLAPILFLIHLIYGEITCSTLETHRLPGYAAIYLGHKFKALAFAVLTISNYCSMLAYLIIGGSFLFGLLNPIFGGSEIIYLLIFFAVGSTIIYRGTKSIKEAETLMTVGLLTLIAGLIIISLPQIKTIRLLTPNPANLFLPYGIILFSLWGLSAVPAIKEMFPEQNPIKNIRRAISINMVICVIAYLSFIAAIVGVSGAMTSQDALTGLALFFSPKIMLYGYLFGFLATFTSYLTIGHELNHVFLNDYNFKKIPAAIAACGMPLLLIFLGFKDFLKIISLTGAISLGVISIIILLIYLKLIKSGQPLTTRLPIWTIYFMMTVLTLGILIGIFYGA